MAAGFDFQFFIAPFFLLVCFAIFLFGAFTVQVYYYWFAYENDSVTLRAFVLFMWLLECFHTAMCIHIMYTDLILDTGDPLAALHPVWSVGVSVLLEIVIVSMAQSFYIHRIWRLSKHNILATATPVVLLICRLGFGFATGALFFKFATYIAYREDKAALVVIDVSLALAAVIDLVICGLLTYFLRRQKSAFKKTNDLVQRLVFYTVNTGALTMMVSVATVFAFTFLPTTLVFGGFVEVLSKLYANTMLALLNARSDMQKQGQSSSGVTSIPLGVRGGAIGTSHSHQNAMRVDVYTDVTVDEGHDMVYSGQSSKGMTYGSAV